MSMAMMDSDRYRAWNHGERTTLTCLDCGAVVYVGLLERHEAICPGKGR